MDRSVTGLSGARPWQLPWLSIAIPTFALQTTTRQSPWRRNEPHRIECPTAMHQETRDELGIWSLWLADQRDDARENGDASVLMVVDN